MFMAMEKPNYRTSSGLLSIISLNKCEEISQKQDCCLNTFNIRIIICSVPSNGVTYLCNEDINLSS